MSARAQEDFVPVEKVSAENLGEEASRDLDKIRSRAKVLRQYIGEIPAKETDGLSVGREHQILLDDWEYVDIDGEDSGSLVDWVRKASQFVNFFIQSQKAKKSKYRQLINDIEDVGSINANWHYPWIDGWEDAATRKALIKQGKAQNKPEGLGMGVKVAIVGAAGAAALYMLTRED